jgi:hypothetical protein
LALFVTEILLINDAYFYGQSDPIFKLTLLLPLGFVLAVALRLFSEDFGWRDWRSYADMLVIPLLVLYYFLMPGEDDFSDISILYYIVFVLVALIGLCIAPYRSLARPSLFWQYNVKIWWGASFSLICTVVFLGGLCLALTAVDALFNVNISDKWYAYLATFWGILFAPLFFATNIPAQSQLGEEQENNYTILRVFGQYVLLPILVVYLLIFYAYGLKIIINWELPKGWVSLLTLVYSFGGLFIYFLLHHFFTTKTTKIATFFGRYFFYSELPVVALLLAAIFRRTVDYGITENRYFLWLGGFWLLGISLYMIMTKGKSFRPVLVSFACMALFSIVGPWSAVNVSECSQMHRLEKLLTKQEWLKKGCAPDSAQIQQAVTDYQQVQDIEDYFSRKKNRVDSFSSDIDSLCEKFEHWYENDYLEYADNTEQGASAYFEVTTKEEQPLKISGYDRMLYFHYEVYDADEAALTAADSTLACKIKKRDNDHIELYRYGTLVTTISLPDAIRQISGIDWDNISSDQTVTDEMRVVINSKYAVLFTEIAGYRNDSTFNIIRAKMYVLEKE